MRTFRQAFLAYLTEKTKLATTSEPYRVLLLDDEAQGKAETLLDYELKPRD